MVARVHNEFEYKWLAEEVEELRGVPIFYGPGLEGREVKYRLSFLQ